MSDEHMSDKDMDAVLREWTQDAPAGQPDRSRVVGDVVRQLGSTRRRRRRRWLQRLFSRKPDEPAAVDKTKYQPSSIPATNGYTPTAIERTTSMLSPVKAITAGAIVFAIGGVMLVSQTVQQPSSVPGAATAPGDPAVFTADATLAGPYVEVGCESGDGVQHCRDEFQMAVDATDPRASGTLTYGVNRDTHALTVKVHAGTITIENDDGMWAGTFTGYWPQQGGRTFHAQLEGRDGYEGWTMLLDDFCRCTTPTSDMQGVIIPGDLPSAE